MSPPLYATQPQLPLLRRLSTGSQAYAMVAVVQCVQWARGWYRYLYPTRFDPDVSKSYTVRPNLSIRIFYPAGSRIPPIEKLPTLFTIHGGGFTIGSPADDDVWNRLFADAHNTLVIGLDYSKAPLNPYPTAIYDVEALILAILEDTAIPVDERRCAIAGFSAGGNLTLAVSQLDGLKKAFASRGSPGFSAAIPVYPSVDRTTTRDMKATQRFYKPDLSPNRNASRDYLLPAGRLFDWSYLPVGQNLADPLVSPIMASRSALPPHIFVIACELDLLGHDAWRMACQLAGRPEPSRDEKVGRRECGAIGELELRDERFAWEARERGIRWLLVPDVVHGFDRLPPILTGDSTSVEDAEAKKVKVIQEIGVWLRERVWT